MYNSIVTIKRQKNGAIAAPFNNYNKIDRNMVNPCPGHRDIP
jgi:hypothetical protein